jgi:hypothetical protein
MKYSILYWCESCPNTEVLIWDEERVGEPFDKSRVPLYVWCGRHNCDARCWRIDLKPEKDVFEEALETPRPWKIRVPILMFMVAFSWLIIATFWWPARIIFLVCMGIAILQFVVANA